MQYHIYNYRFAREIIEHSAHNAIFENIKRIIAECPVYRYPNKSSRNPRLDVLQQLQNTYFDQRFVSELGWAYHPDATTIPDSDLAADFRTRSNGLRVQTEVQFGNMARWYTDIFKFQTAYSQDLIDMGLCIVPMGTLARRIDSNISNYERCIRELPSAKMSITLPILIIGLDADASTLQYDISTTPIGQDKNSITGKGMVENRYRIVHGIRSGTPLSEITAQSPTGPMIPIDASAAEPDEEE